MRFELSSLFSLDYVADIVKQVHIGDGVHIEEIKLSNWIAEVCQQIKEKNEDEYWRLVVREKLEWHPYTHRFHVSLDGVAGFSDPQIERAQQQIMRAIVLSRIVKPTPIPLHATQITTIYPDIGDRYHKVAVNVGFYGTAYVVRESHPLTITQTDAELIANYWVALQHFHDNEPDYRRIVRALKCMNDAYHVEPAQLCHTTFHSALEALICTSHYNNKRQVTERLPQLVNGITEDQASAIYEFCVDVKHTAAPALLYSANVTNMDCRDKRRYDATEWLEHSLRSLFTKALEDRSFADELANPKTLGKKYPVK